MKTTIERFLNMLCLDNRIPNGIFSLENNDHLDILQEYLVKYGVPMNEAVDTRNKVLEGRFPERQAYNKNGILVTFPTPEYKQRSIQRGTHFEQNPAKQASNLFPQSNAPTQGQPAPTQPASTPAPPTETPQQPSPAGGDQKREEPSKLAPATSGPSSTAPAPSEVPTTSAPPAAVSEPEKIEKPAEQPTSSSAVPTVPPSTSITPEPEKKPTVPQSQTKTPEQKKAEAEYVEKLLRTEEITIEEARNLGWRCTLRGHWYNNENVVMGKTVYNERLNKQVVSPII